MSPRPPAEDPLIGTVLSERYRIDRLIGEGGMGAVYLAEHVRMRKQVAVKVLHSHVSGMSEAELRFEREAVAAGRVDHPHLVSATDFGELGNGDLFLVLEYVPGVSVADVLQGGPMAPLRALDIARQITDALVALHASGVVHRDLKPDNIMLVDRDDGQDFVKLLDFGMAKVGLDPVAAEAEKRITMPGMIFGTPKFMAPEQASGKVSDYRADLYSLGILLYMMLSGRVPFDAPEIRAVLRMQVYEEPATLPEHIDPHIRALVMNLLAKDPEERIQFAEELRDRLDQLLAQLRGEVRKTQPSVLDVQLDKVRRVAPLRVVGGIAAVSFVVGIFMVRALGPGAKSEPTALPVESVGAVPSVASTPSSAPVAASASAPAAAPAPKADPHQHWIARARVGDGRAVAELAKVPDAERSAAVWFVLGRDHMRNKRVVEGLAAYRRAVELDATLAASRELAHDVRVAADWEKTGEAAVLLAAQLPSAEGPDILFDVWVSTPRSTRYTKQARRLLESEVVRKHASEAVQVALDLRNARGCEQFLTLMPRALEHGDMRSVRPLMRLHNTTGCGRNNAEDCFSCLRPAKWDKRALAAARGRPAPDLKAAHAPIE